MTVAIVGISVAHATSAFEGDTRGYWYQKKLDFLANEVFSDIWTLYSNDGGPIGKVRPEIQAMLWKQKRFFPELIDEYFENATQCMYKGVRIERPGELKKEFPDTWKEVTGYNPDGGIIIARLLFQIADDRQIKDTIVHEIGHGSFPEENMHYPKLDEEIGAKCQSGHCGSDALWISIPWYAETYVVAPEDL